MSDAIPDPVLLFTDGACLGNPGPGGWAFLLRQGGGGEETEGRGGETDTTNNRMELQAVIQGLAALKEPSRVRLCCDSVYIVKGISEWLPDWKGRNWRKADKKPVLNKDLWQALDRLLQTHRVEPEWVEAHTGHPENERCDKMAAEEAKRRKA